LEQWSTNNGGSAAETDMLIKSQLIGELSKNFPHLPEKDIALAVNHIIEHMSDILSQGGRIEIRGFGSFNLHYRPPRRAHNPKTGEKLVTNPKYAVHFKPGKEMRERVNANRNIPIEALTREEMESEND
jgi:integration host factor subunit beta